MERSLWVQVFDGQPAYVLALSWGSVALWIVSVVVVIFSRKLRRKFWWGICTLVTFAWTFESGDTTTIVALPLGATLVIAVALFGPRPRPKGQALTADGSKDAADGWW
ncbi:MAG: hypothetical protein HY859_12910 [Caulobacterales bacterium]|nr:hypothetical protein [Caulobacterales bacterium]